MKEENGGERGVEPLNMPVLNHDRRSDSSSCFILSKKVLNLLIQDPRRGKEEV
jgi:hypothetical protein